jgi:hypothetical protein
MKTDTGKYQKLIMAVRFSRNPGQGPGGFYSGFKNAIQMS